MEFHDRTKSLLWLLLLILFGVLVGGSVYLMTLTDLQKDKDYLQEQIDNIQRPGISTDAATQDEDDTADWQTYTNEEYGFSFRYPTQFKLDEKSLAAGNTEKYNITMTDEVGKSFYVGVLNMEGKTAREFIEDWYGEMESGPSNISESTINDNKVFKLFLEKASTIGSSGSAVVVFTDRNYAIPLSTSVIGGEMREIMDNEVLNKIALTFKFTN